jgi:hypothetical protein
MVRNTVLCKEQPMDQPGTNAAVLRELESLKKRVVALETNQTWILSAFKALRRWVSALTDAETDKG